MSIVGPEGQVLGGERPYAGTICFRRDATKDEVLSVFNAAGITVVLPNQIWECLPPDILKHFLFMDDMPQCAVGVALTPADLGPQIKANEDSEFTS